MVCRGVRGAQVMEKPVPRYFLVVECQDMQVDDARGSVFPTDAAAVAYAGRVVRGLRGRGNLTDLTLTMVVKRESCGTIQSIPFFPGHTSVR
jgi:hypothetical protein